MVACDLDRSFEEHISILDEIDESLRHTRRNLVRNLIESLQDREQEWDNTFRDLLKKSQQGSENQDHINQTFQLLNYKPLAQSNASNNNHQQGSSNDAQPERQTTFVSLLEPIKETTEPPPTPKAPVTTSSKQTKPQPNEKPTIVPKIDSKEQLLQSRRKSNKQFADPAFSNHYAIKEFVRIQALLNDNRDSFASFAADKGQYQTYKNDLNIFIRTQINAISNSDQRHLDTKIRLLTDLFKGSQVPYQGRTMHAGSHPGAIAFCMDVAALTFVTVGTRLVNSAPAIASSMASVINGIANNNFPNFRDLVIGHLQERCPFIIPLYPDPDELGQDGDNKVKHKIACGYLLDTKTQTLEDDEKYLLRMRSMVLIYATIIGQNPAGLSWSWLASFLSLYPEPVITATILQAFLQETYKKLSVSYGRHYIRLLNFIRNKYVTMIDEVTPKTSDRQSLTKLEILLSEI